MKNYTHNRCKLNMCGTSRRSVRHFEPTLVSDFSALALLIIVYKHHSHCCDKANLSASVGIMTFVTSHLRPQAIATRRSFVSIIPCATFHRSRTSRLQTLSFVTVICQLIGVNILPLTIVFDCLPLHTSVSLIRLAVTQRASFPAIYSVNPLGSPPITRWLRSCSGKSRRVLHKQCLIV